MPKYEKKLVIIACHGVGDWRYDHDGLSWFEPMYKRIWDLAWKGSGKKIPEDFLRVYPVKWGPIVQKFEDDFQAEMDKFIRGRFGLFNWIFNKVNNAIRRGLISSAGDVIASFQGMKWELIRRSMKHALMHAVAESARARHFADLPNDSQTLTMLIGHSLGSVILTRFCHEIGSRSGNHTEIAETRRGLKLNTIVTFGSPCPLWEALSEDGITPKFPGEPNPDLKPTWLNIWSQMDPASGPVEPGLKDNYPKDRVNIVDKKVVIPGILGRLPVVPHTQYARSRTACYLIAQRIIRTWEALENQS